MPDDLFLLLESRGAAALLYGVAVGALLRLLGLARNRGAGTAALAIAAAFVPGGWAGAHLAAVVLGLAGAAGRLARPGRSHRPGWLDVVSITGPFIVALWAGILGELDGLWTAAAIAALGAGAGAWLARAIPSPAGAARYRPPRPWPVEEGDGIGAAVLVAAVLAPPVIATIAHVLGIIGTGEGGPIALGAVAGLALIGDARSRLRALFVGVAGAIAGALLTAFLV